MTYVRIAGWGKYLPERIMPNAELGEYVDTSDEWIRSRTGIVERRIAAPEETTCTLAVNAARCAMERAGVGPDDLDLIIVATCTPDYSNMPATASRRGGTARGRSNRPNRRDGRAGVRPPGRRQSIPEPQDVFGPHPVGDTNRAGVSFNSFSR